MIPVSIKKRNGGHKGEGERLDTWERLRAGERQK